MPIAENTVIVSAPVADVYERWTHFDRFNEFMSNITSVEMTGPKTSHWVVKGPLGTSVKFDADTTLLEPNKRIAWNSRDGGDIKTSGQVTFNELGTSQTEVHVISNPQKQLEEDMDRFKQLANHSKAAPA